MADEASSGSGYGQQDPTDSASPHNSEIFKIQQELSRVATTKLVQVQSVNVEKQTVDVQIMVNQTDGAGNATAHGIIYGVPYMNMQAGSTLLKVAPVKGDQGVMVVIDRDISAVQSTKKISNPGSPRRFDVADGIFLGGMQALSSTTPDQTIEITDNGLKATLKHGNILEASSTGWAFTGPVIFNDTVTAKQNLQLGGQNLSDTGTLYGGGIHIGGTLNADGGVTVGTISLTAHRHTVTGGVGTQTSAAQV